MPWPSAAKTTRSGYGMSPIRRGRARGASTLYQGYRLWAAASAAHACYLTGRLTALQHSLWSGELLVYWAGLTCSKAGDSRLTRTGRRQNDRFCGGIRLNRRQPTAMQIGGSAPGYYRRVNHAARSAAGLGPQAQHRPRCRAVFRGVCACGTECHPGARSMRWSWYSTSPCSFAGSGSGQSRWMVRT